MRLSKNQSKIVGLILMDVDVKVLPSTTIQARFALIDGDSNLIGLSTRGGDWSKDVEVAFQAFIEALEKAQLEILFGAESDESADPGAVASPKDIPTF